jgi:hypothetical protein
LWTNSVRDVPEEGGEDDPFDGAGVSVRSPPNDVMGHQPLRTLVASNVRYRGFHE